MGRSRSIVWVIVAGLAVVALAIALLRPTTETTTSEPVPDYEDATADDPMVIGQFEEGGFSLLGITFTSPTYRIRVGFSAPGACAEVIQAAVSWPTGAASCGPEGAVAGTIAGTGRTASDRALVGVDFEVGEECFDAVRVGTRWPPGSPACPVFLPAPGG